MKKYRNCLGRTGIRAVLPKSLTQNRFSWFVADVAAVFFLLCGTSIVHASTIYPGDPIWQPDLRGAGSAVISGDIPHLGHASLALETTGSLYDWAFYTQYAGDKTTAFWGYLSELNAVSFDWYRKEISIHQNDVPWLAQTPVLRLLVRDDTQYSELIWEKYYTNSNPAVTNQWITQDVIDQNLWRYVTGAGYTIKDQIAGVINKEDFSPNSLFAVSVASWLQYYSSSAVVYGLSVGVGSNWPDKYEGCADNLLLSFSNGKVIHDNFELPEPVPEPSTVTLLLSGIIFFYGTVKMRRLRKHTGS